MVKQTNKNRHAHVNKQSKQTRSTYLKKTNKFISPRQYLERFMMIHYDKSQAESMRDSRGRLSPWHEAEGDVTGIFA